jgi:hypothetical protein
MAALALGCAPSSKSSDDSKVMATAVSQLYQQKQGDNSTDIFLIYTDGTMSIEHTRQVGGPGGISNKGVVPYPTLCRVLETGKIVEQDQYSWSYEVTDVALTDQTGLTDNEHCVEYIEAFKKEIPGGIEFSIYKNEFTKVK